MSSSNNTPRIQISLSKSTSGTATANANASTSATATPQPSSSSLLGNNNKLYKSVRKALKNQTLNFKINVECTSLKLSPSGNFLWGGFSDGTLRVWDLSSTFTTEDDNVIASRQKMDVMVNSKLTQGYGAVACQIHARGVHTDLITLIDISDDAQYVFMGVSRGATEVYAVYIGDLEAAVHHHKKQQQSASSSEEASSSGCCTRNILDYLKVYCHSDAKLKGFGACATTTTKGSDTSSSIVTTTTGTGTGIDTSYLLLTGKGIKNIHIWKFTPPKYHPRSSSIGYEYDENENDDNGIWDQLYDTPTNGNTIVLLGFHFRESDSKLLAVSKSDVQKLRLWDLSFEQEQAAVAVDEKQPPQQRPKRPPHQDVDNSQYALDIAGGIGVCTGGNMYNVMSIVSLDRPNDPFNHTELALPTPADNNGGRDSPNDFAQTAYSSRRQRRGEMKAVVNVATSPRDSSHALLELDDGSLIGYSAGASTSAKDSSSSNSHHGIPRLAMASPESTGIPALPADFWRRCICLANISGVVIAASSLYNPNTNKGQLVIRALGGLKKPRSIEKRQPKSKQVVVLQQSTPPPQATPSKQSSSPIAADQQALRDAVSVPPMDGSRANNKKKLLMPPPSSSSSSKLTRVSPDQKQTSSMMITPSHHQQNQKDATNSTTTIATTDDSPESIEGQSSISEYLQPKRIVMQQQQVQEQQKQTGTSSIKKRKIVSSSTTTKTTKTGTDKSGGSQTTTIATSLSSSSSSSSSLSKKESNAIKKARKEVTESIPKKTSNKAAESVVTGSSKDKQEIVASPAPTFMLNSIGSIPINVPKTGFGGPPVKFRKPPKTTTASAISAIYRNPVTPSDVVTGKKRDRSTVSSSLSSSSTNDDIAIVPKKKVAHSNADVTTALLLTELAVSPSMAPPPAKSASSGTASKVTIGSIKSKMPPPSASISKSSSGTFLPKAKASISPSALIQQQQQASRELVLQEKITEQYKQLRTFLQDVTNRSMDLIHSRNLRGPVPSALDNDKSRSSAADQNHLSTYSCLLTEHRAAHDYLQRRLLRSAETTLRLLLESSITTEEARTELKQTITKFEGILYDTLHRQELERLSVVSQHPGTTANLVNGGRGGHKNHRKLQQQPSSLEGGTEKQTAATKPYPCQAAFEKVEDICAAITRPVGRPKRGND